MTETVRTTETRWIDVGPCAKAPVRVIATAGTQSSASASAAEYLWCERGAGPVPAVELLPSYESAARTVLSGEASHLLVPNGHPSVTAFYENAELRFSTAFVHSTPYVLAGTWATDREVPRVAIPAGLSAVAARLLAGRFETFRVGDAGEDNEALAAVQDGRADLTVLTIDRARACGLPVLPSPYRSQMLWSVFRPVPPVS